MKRFLSVSILLAFVLCSFPIKASALSLSAESAILINGNTGTVLYSLNENEKLPMASTTKIMTALLLAEQNTHEKTVTVTKEMVTVEGSSMGLLEGDSVSYYSLLCGMLMSSGNDAANTAAISVAGSLEAFAKLMNLRANEIGMQNTNFVTPSGLDAPEHYSTAFDMALLARAAMRCEAFRQIVSKQSVTTEYGNPPYKRRLTNHNKLISMYDGCIGIKTGFTKKSGRCLVSAAEKDGEYLIAVTLNAPNDWSDHKELFDYGFSVLEPFDVKDLCPVADVFAVGGDNKYISTVCESQIIGLTKAEYESITTHTSIEPFVYAPINDGDVVGKFKCLLNGEVFIEKNILSKDVSNFIEPKNKSFGEKFLDKFNFLLQLSK